MSFGFNGLGLCYYQILRVNEVICDIGIIVVPPGM